MSILATKNNYKYTKLACYCAYFTMSSVFSLPPLLFVTLHNMYGISYTLLGTLVLVNFCTQLFIDLVFSFFSKHFNIKKIVRVMPLITSFGMMLYALIPMLLPAYAYFGLVISTVIFSVASGLSEVLLSPMIAAIPSQNPQKDMSMLHSLYAFGVFTVVLISTFFLKVFGTHNWMYLTMLLASLPIIAAVLFMISPMPDMQPSADVQTQKQSRRHYGDLLLCVGCIFFGSCAEGAMSNWISSYMENALKIDKALGDVLGMAMFAVLLGLTRILYAKFGKNIFKMLFICMIGSVICYITVGLSMNVIIAFLACVLTGVFTSMLWPGSLIMMEENVPKAGVAAFALMAAGGDLGASVSPQLAGIIIDNVTISDFALKLSEVSGLSTEQIAIKAAMLSIAVFPMVGCVVLYATYSRFKKRKI